MNSSQGLRREIAELEALLARAPNDPESRWACYLLRDCLHRRRAQLARLRHEDAAASGSH